MKRTAADIVREYGPFGPQVNGVTFDGAHLWLALGDSLAAVDPQTGAEVRKIATPAHAGAAFDGRHLYQIAGERINKLDPATGAVVASLPTPEGGAAGMAWAEGRLWVGQHRKRRIHQIDPETGAVLHTLESNRFVTGVTFADGQLWHATMQDEASELRRVDPTTGEVLEVVEMPKETVVSGLESDGGDLFFCGGGRSGKVRAVRRPRLSDQKPARTP